MSPDRVPAVALSITAAGFMVWAVILVTTAGGSRPVEWGTLAVAVACLVLGVRSARVGDRRRSRAIRWLLVTFAVFGVVAVLGLTADDSSSRSWVRLGWASLGAGYVTALIAWWGAPRIDRRVVTAGGVVGAVLIAGAAGITANCDPTIQRTWCDPGYEHEQSVAERIAVEGALRDMARVGGKLGPVTVEYLVASTSIEEVTETPPGFVYQSESPSEGELARGRYVAADGGDAGCRIDVRLEPGPDGNLETMHVACSGLG